MKAVRLRGRLTHYVYDSHITHCGRQLIDLPIIQELDVGGLGADERICVACAEIVKLDLEPEAAPRLTLKPAPGRLIKTGPLYHGLHGRKHGQWLGDDWGD